MASATATRRTRRSRVFRVCTGARYRALTAAGLRRLSRGRAQARQAVAGGAALAARDQQRLAKGGRGRRSIAARRVAFAERHQQVDMPPPHETSRLLDVFAVTVEGAVVEVVAPDQLAGLLKQSKRLI